MTKVPQDIGLAGQAGAEMAPAPNGAGLSDFLDLVESEISAYFSVRALAGREGLFEWELRYIIGRISLAVKSRGLEVDLLDTS